MINAGARRTSMQQVTQPSLNPQAWQRLTSLEAEGLWLEACTELRHWLCDGFVSVNADNLHWLGRLYQRLGAADSECRAYGQALRLDPQRPATYNNLALLELARLDARRAEVWLLKGLQLPHLSDDQADLLHATACDLYLYRLCPEQALHYVELQLQRRVSVMALANRAICHHKLGQFEQAVATQKQAINLQLQQQAAALAARPLTELVAMPLSDPAQSAQLQLQLMKY